MNVPPTTPASSSTSPVSTYLSSRQNQARKPAPNEPSSKPDWLLIMTGALFLLTLLIVWLVGLF